MLAELVIESGHVSLICTELDLDHRRPLKLDGLADMAERYAEARERGDEATLLSLGRELYGWLDGEEGWLSELLNLVERGMTAVAVNALVAGRLASLSEAEKIELVPLVLAGLFAAWGGATGSSQRPYIADIELTWLGLLAHDSQVIACCATDAVREWRATSSRGKLPGWARRPSRSWNKPASNSH
jgi:hypothetical protein